MKTLIRILILEHDYNDLEFLVHTLKKSELDFVSEVVETREQFVLALENFIPDIILSDFTLPDFDGLSAFNIKNDICPDTPMIIVSGTIGEENAIELIKKGVTDCVLKEKLYQIVTKIQRALRETEERLQNLRAQQKLLENAKMTQNILESITEAFVSINRNWIVKYWNKEAEAIVGVKKVEILNKNFLIFFAEKVSPNFKHYLHQAMNDDTNMSFEDFVEPLNIWLKVNIYSSNDGITLYFKDVTESKRIQYVNNLQKDVFEHYTGQGSCIESTIQILLDGIEKIHPEFYTSLLKIRDGKLYYWGFSALPTSFIAETDGMNIADSAGCSGAAALLTQKVESSNITIDPLWKGQKDSFLKHGLNACVAYPIIDPYQNILCVFTVYSKIARSFTKSETDTLEVARYSLQNILDNFKAGETVKASEEKYRELFLLHPLPIWLFDVETKRFLDVNEAAINHYGYSREEFLTMTIMDIRPQEDRVLLDRELDSARDAGHRTAGVFKHLTKEGKLIFADIKSNEFAFKGIKARLIMANDVTKKVEADRLLTLSEQRFKALVQKASELIGIVDEEGNYKYVSPALALVIGQKPEKVIGINIFESIHPDDRAMVVKRIKQMISSKRNVTWTFRYQDNSGAFRWLESAGTNLLDDPAVEGIVINSKDITERINHIHSIEERNARLVEISWIQSHIVRAPLARIMEAVNLLTDKDENDGLDRELLHYIILSANELDRIIQDIVEKTDKENNTLV